jgi:hypothetical protein
MLHSKADRGSDPRRDHVTSISARQPGTIRAAAALQALLGVGFGAGAIVTLANLATSGELPMTPFGFRMFSGPFERLGTAAFSALLSAFAGICALDLVAARWLWQGRRRGATLGWITSIPAFALSVGFALPIMLVAVPIRVALLVSGRRALR